MAEDKQSLLLPPRYGVSSLVQGSENEYSGYQKRNGLSTSEETAASDLSAWPVCRHYPRCEICEKCAMHDVYQKRVSFITKDRFQFPLCLSTVVSFILFFLFITFYFN